MANLHVLKRLRNSTIYTKIASLASVSLLLTSSALTICVSFSSVASADALNYPWPTDTEAPCKFAPNGGSSCTNPNDSSDKYDWGVNSGGTFHPYRNGYEYRNCTDYVQWREAQSDIGVSVPTNWGNGGQWYDNAPVGEQSTTAKAWDAAVVPGNPGHVAFLQSVNTDGTITVTEYNHDTQGHGDSRTGTASSMGFTSFVDFGVHPASAGSGTVTSSQVISGVEHIFVGDSNGGIQDISWGSGQQTTEYQVTSLGSSISKMTSQVINGVITVVFASGVNLYSVSWGNGVQPSITGQASFSQNITALSSRVTSDGAIHAYVGSGPQVWNVSWGNGTTFNKTLLTSEGAVVNALSNQITSDGYQNVYVGQNDGKIMHIYWLSNPSLAQQWQPGTVGAAVVDITSQLVNGVTNIDAATSTTVTNFRYGNGASFAQNTGGSVSGMTITAVGTVLTSDGYQHAIASTSTGGIEDIYWTDPAQHAQWQPGTMSAQVVGLSTLLINGVIQANGITSAAAYNMSWGGGVNPTVIQESTYM